MPRSAVNYRTIALISHASDVTLKVIQQPYVEQEMQMFKLDSEQEETFGIQLQTSLVTGMFQKISG